MALTLIPTGTTPSQTDTGLDQRTQRTLDVKPMSTEDAGGCGPARSATTSWKERRAELLQEASNRVEELIKSGVRSGRAIKGAANEFANADLGDGRRLSLSKGTMQRFWYRWKNHRDPSIFRLRYAGPGRPVVDPILLKLVVEDAFGRVCR